MPDIWHTSHINPNKGSGKSWMIDGAAEEYAGTKYFSPGPIESMVKEKERLGRCIQLILLIWSLIL